MPYWVKPLIVGIPTICNAWPMTSPLHLQTYIPAYLNWLSNKLSRSASEHYRRHFGVGIEVWRLLVELRTHGHTSVQEASRALGMDKASVSRALHSMEAQGLIDSVPSPHDGRARECHLTDEGAALHDRMASLALLREQALLSCLAEPERAQLLSLLQRLHAHLPEVERQTLAWCAQASE